ncbi:PH domain-containing protein [Microlunatus sp. Y2014]|uniref:PH domain-containing protein n=1 Tax=Microlunatus sp. Y2014 TaxID=3418488 RepID=UPI003DA70244
MSSVGLRPPANRADPRAVGWWGVQQASWVVPTVLVLGVLGLLIPPARLWLWLPGGLVLVVGLVLILLLPRYWYRNQLWEAGDTAVHARRGWLWVESRIAPFSRVQTVDRVRGPLEQRFGLATVVVTTASSRGPVKIAGLAVETADELVARLTELTEATAEDAV